MVASLIQNRRRRRRRRIAAAAAAALLSLAAGLYLAVEYIPAWYVPVELADTDLPRVRRQSGQWADDVGDRMVRGERFTVELAQRECNEFLAALPDVVPEARQAWPESVRRPAVCFHPGGVRLGAQCGNRGWQAIVSADLSVAVSDGGDYLVVTLDEARGGALAVPAWLLRRVVDPALAPLQATEARAQAGAEGTRPAAGSESPRSWLRTLDGALTADALLDGVRVRNRFTWPNGRRRFHVAAIEFQDGGVRVTVEPW